MNECTARKIANNKNIADIYIARYRTTSVTSVIGVPNYLATNVSRVGFPAPATADVKTKRDIPYPPYIFLTNTVLVVSPIPPAKLVCELPTHILDATSRGFVNFMGSQYNTSTSESFARMKSVNTAYIEVEVNRINANTTSLKSVLMDGCFSSISHIVTRLAKMMEYTAQMIAANKSIADEYIARMNSVIRVPMSAHMAYDLSSMGNSEKNSVLSTRPAASSIPIERCAVMDSADRTRMNADIGSLDENGAGSNEDGTRKN
ncbi:unnamed protein product [Orchesella dallaii]|uniref:Uncharacterized protein n=1 Tax=Orchesella dallaii TaxID=48710 RepID=A0ABP1RZX3_9HEXA